MKRKLAIVFGFIMVMIISFPGTVSATTENSQATDSSTTQSTEAETAAGNVGFSVTAITPETQVDRSISFFYPVLTPGEEQTLYATVYNSSSEAQMLDLSITNASTASNGVVSYSEQFSQYDESLAYPLTDIAQVEGETTITLEPGEERTVNILVTPKTESFSGVILGAFNVFKHMDEEAEGITTRYGYTIGLMVTEDRRPYNTGGDLVYKSAGGQIYSGYKSIVVNFQNPNPFVIQDVQMSIDIYREDEEEPMISKALSGMTIAPNTNFDFPLQLGLEDMTPGNYRMVGSASNSTDSWAWDEEFSISQNEADDLNQNAAYKLALSPLYYQLLIALSVLTLLLLALLVYLKFANKMAKSNKRKIANAKSQSRKKGKKSSKPSGNKSKEK